jgi:hypothetical protein
VPVRAGRPGAKRPFLARQPRSRPAPPRGRYRGHRHEQPGGLGAALAQWTDRASATGKAAERRAGGTAAGAIDAMLHLLRGQVTREIRQAGDAPR